MQYATRLVNFDSTYYFDLEQDAINYGRKSGFQYSVWLCDKSGKFVKQVYCNYVG